jgi:hypothetical protein
LQGEKDSHNSQGGQYVTLDHGRKHNDNGKSLDDTGPQVLKTRASLRNLLDVLRDQGNNVGLGSISVTDNHFLVDGRREGGLDVRAQDTGVNPHLLDTYSEQKHVEEEKATQPKLVVFDCVDFFIVRSRSNKIQNLKDKEPDGEDDKN